MGIFININVDLGVVFYKYSFTINMPFVCGNKFEIISETKSAYQNYFEIRWRLVMWIFFVAGRR